MSAAERGPTEKQWAATVVEAARRLGWKVYFTWNSRHSPPGFPDLVILRAPRCIMAELKTAKGRTTPAQDDWLDGFRAVPAIETFLWRPADFDDIVELLR